MSDNIKAITCVTVSRAWYSTKKQAQHKELAEAATIKNTEKAARNMRITHIEQSRGTKAKHQIIKDQSLTISFMNESTSRRAPRFPLGFRVWRKDDGVECAVESFIWFPPIKDYIFKVRPEFSENAPSDWLGATRLLGPLEWTELLKWTESLEMQFRKKTGRFHKGNTYSISIDDAEYQMALQAQGIQATWEES